MSAADTPPAADAVATVRAYHARSKHHLKSYAAGPETLDWDAQPDPWRVHEGAARHRLPLPRPAGGPDWRALDVPQGVAPQAPDAAALGQWLGLSLGLAAWKQAGPDRWAVRCNPSSGNLHPTEAWLWLRGLAPATGLPDGLYHYLPREHALERRAALACGTVDAASSGGPAAPPIAPAPNPRHERPASPALWLALSSIHWREAWKYGERAFRYGQLDAGHARAGLAWAAALHGWRLRPQPVDAATLAARLGLDRLDDRRTARGLSEAEDPEVLLVLQAPGLDADPGLPPTGRDWSGRPNRLDRHPMYRWPVIDGVAAASAPDAGTERAAPARHTTPPGLARADDARACADADAPGATPPSCLPQAEEAAATVQVAARPPRRWPAALPAPASAPALLRQRRSAQRFDRQAVMPRAAFERLLQALQPDPALAPWMAAPPGPARVHPVLFTHRVEGLAPGAWLLERGSGARARLAPALSPELAWQPAAPDTTPGAAPAPPLWRLADNPALAGTLRTLCCHQALGSDACVAVAMLAEFDLALAEHGASGYRRLLQECGVIGQVLYLEAEATGLRGTGIGCFFDDAVHQLLGIADGDTRLQSLYHFTLGVPVADARIASDPPYAHLQALGTSVSTTSTAVAAAR
ncbi:MAG: hypothetical protein RIQ53_4789 [Pseudomonadota bacterium]|jgi:SagB-type dehydrogenase family enzyme